MAAKKSKNRPAKRRNRQRKKLKSIKSRLSERVKKRQEFSNATIQIDPPGKEKMSAVILEFVDPFLRDSPNDEVSKKIIGFAILAWNYAIMHEKIEDHEIRGLVRESMRLDVTDAYLKDFKKYLKMLVDHKRKFYPDNKRLILDYEIASTRDKFHLNAVSAQLPSA